MNFIELDRAAYADLGLTPRQVDEYSWRDLWVMFAGARDRAKERWQHTMMLTQAVMNHGGNGIRDPKPLTYLYDRTFGRRVSVTPVDKGRVRSLLSSISKRVDDAG